MYAFTVGFKPGETTPELLYGPDTPVEKQDADLDQAARLDDGGGHATVEIVYSNGRPKRRVEFTTPAQKAAREERETAALAKKAAAAQEKNKARIAALKAELGELEAEAETAAETEAAAPMTAAEIMAAAVPADAEIIAAEVAALSADIEAAEADTDAPAENPDPDSAAPPVSGKRKK